MYARREGMALAMVMLLVLLMGSIATAAAMLSSSSWVMTQYKERQGNLAAVADAGVEWGRARLNGDTVYPQNGYVTLEDSVAVTDANGDVIPGVRRYTYAGPIGVTTGQYGVFGTIVSVALAGNGDRVIRRLEVVQESFAKYAYFTDIEPSNIAFGGGDQLWGPVHSNDNIQIYSSGATFNDRVTTSGEVDPGKEYGTFNGPLIENAPRIPMPQTASLTRLAAQAALGSTSFVAAAGGDSAQSTLRIEFMAIDLDGDNLTTGADEGFMRVYRSNSNPAWVTANKPSGGMTTSRNCGDMHDAVSDNPSSSGTNFRAAKDHPFGGHSASNALAHSTRRCYPGGADALWDGAFVADDGIGQYDAWPGAVDPRLNLRDDKNYLFPLSRALNPNFKGVIYVQGKVAVSGVLRGRVTLAATDNIILIDDLTYATNPGAVNCADIMGIFSGKDFVIADNTINSPVQPSGSGAYLTYDDTKDEFIHGVVLALVNFRAQNHSTGSNTAQPCSSTNWGRGCLFLTGGVIQQTRGPVGTGGGTGYLKRYSYDTCAFSNPPPYFPTTGRFARARLLEVDPTGFDIATLFDLLTPDS